MWSKNSSLTFKSWVLQKQKKNSNSLRILRQDKTKSILMLKISRMGQRLRARKLTRTRARTPVAMNAKTTKLKTSRENWIIGKSTKHKSKWTTNLAVTYKKLALLTRLSVTTEPRITASLKLELFRVLSQSKKPTEYYMTLLLQARESVSIIWFLGLSVYNAIRSSALNESPVSVHHRKQVLI